MTLPIILKQTRKQTRKNLRQVLWLTNCCGEPGVFPMLQIRWKVLEVTLSIKMEITPIWMNGQYMMLNGMSFRKNKTKKTEHIWLPHIRKKATILPKVKLSLEKRKCLSQYKKTLMAFIYSLMMSSHIPNSFLHSKLVNGNANGIWMK